MKTPKTINRDEAFQIYLKLIEVSGGKDIGSLLELATNLAKDFETTFTKQDDSHLLPQTEPTESLCRFYSLGTSLLIETSSGERFLIAEYGFSSVTRDMAIALNSLFKVEA